jgi:hypothetical protein
MSHLIRRAAPVVLAAAVLGAAVAPPAGASESSAKGAVAAAGKCKKKKKKKQAQAGTAAKKRKKCKRGGGGSGGGGGGGLPGQPTPATPQPGGGSGSGSGGGGGTDRLVADITVTDNPVLGGEETQGEVEIDDPAPEGGQPVDLSDGGSARTVIPESVHVAEGETTAGFTVETTVGVTTVVGIQASIGASHDVIPLQIVAEPSVDDVDLEFNCFPDAPDTFSGNSVTLDVAPLTSTVITLSTPVAGDSNFLTTDASTTVLPGNLSAPFTANTLLPSASDVTVRGTAPNASFEEDTATIRDGVTQGDLDQLTLSDSTTAPNTTVTGTVTLDCEAISPGATITLQSSDDANVDVPVSVVVAEDELSAQFTITVAPGTPTGDYTITAEFPPGNSRQAVLSVSDLGT